MKYKKHRRIVKIKENVIVKDKFEFIDMTSELIGKEIKQHDPKKALKVLKRISIQNMNW